MTGGLASVQLGDRQRTDGSRELCESEPGSRSGRVPAPHTLFKLVAHFDRSDEVDWKVSDRIECVGASES
jgi:hypothetical protein